MSEEIFKMALAAISSGEYSNDDIKTVKEQIDLLNKKELKIKRQMEKSKNEFVKNKDKSYIELREIRNSIKELRGILKKI